MVDRLVFLDESGINADMPQLYGRASNSQRASAADHILLNTPQTTTVLSSIRCDCEKAFTTYQGGTTGEQFVTYLKDASADLACWRHCCNRQYALPSRKGYPGSIGRERNHPLYLPTALISTQSKNVVHSKNLLCHEAPAIALL